MANARDENGNETATTAKEYQPPKARVKPSDQLASAQLAASLANLAEQGELVDTSKLRTRRANEDRTGPRDRLLETGSTKVDRDREEAKPALEAEKRQKEDQQQSLPQLRPGLIARGLREMSEKDRTPAVNKDIAALLERTKQKPPAEPAFSSSKYKM